jgi:mono/diheme cytochrome c family protein
MKRFVQIAALSAALICAGVAASAGAIARQGHGRAPTAINPAVTFARNCATCHGREGRADTLKSKHRYHARDLTNAHWQSEATDERIYNAILNGVGKMPAFGKKLTTEQITSLVSYIRDLKK